MTTLCVGIDVTWWGGRPNDRTSQRDTIVSGLLDDTPASELSFVTVELSGAPNPLRAQPTEPNFDADGSMLLHAIQEVLRVQHGRYDRCIISLDAPLEARERPGQPPRQKAVRRGERMGSEQRRCEQSLQSHLSAGVSRWNADLRIQSGSPIAPRISRICGALSRTGFSIFRATAEPSDRQIIEIFPSEAIWSLGVLGHYGEMDSGTVRTYKAKQPGQLERGAAFEQARRPLDGFVRLLENLAPGNQADWGAWVEQITTHACEVSVARDPSMIDRGKGYDDPIESGIAFFCSVLFALNHHHVWGDAADGAIVGPGALHRAE